MKKGVLFLLGVFFLAGNVCVKAQDDWSEEIDYSVLSSDSLSLEIGYIPESLDANVDSLLRSWHVKYFAKVDEFCHDDRENIFFHDSIYIERLSLLPRVIPMTYNKTVRDCIDLYASRRRELIRYMLGMADYYFPIMEQVLDENDLPIELKYLAIVESALNPIALSRVGASGLWQFMLPTGKSYGLEINSLVDERRDPVKSTQAACRYFKDMYAIYGDWNLVMASYNCGPGNVNKAIRRSGGKTDFWDIYPFLPKETRSYVPLFIAANYIMNYHCEHNICPVETTLPLATDTVMIDQMLHLQQVADILDMDIELLRTLNPQYKRDIIPGKIAPAPLKLPAVQTFAFVDKEDTVYAHNVEQLLANCIPLDPTDPSSFKAASRERITHTVKAGENLHTIGNIYGVTASDIRKWNGLGSTRVAAGKRISLYVDNGGVAFKSTAPAKNNIAQAKAASTVEKTKQSEPKDGFVSYQVQSGDSLYSISRKYPGVTAATIQQVNQLPNSNIRPGQVLKIPVS